MIDLHAHVLPGVDDGARDLEEAVEMCRLAREDGVTAVVASPHQRHDLWPNQDAGLLASARDELAAAVGPTPTILLGAEIRVDSELLDAVAGIPGNGLLSLAGSRYLMIEFSSLAAAVDPVDLVYELTVAGWIPVVAHPERILWLAGEPDLLAVLVEHGALLQVTAASVTGDLGRGPRACCEWLVDNGLVHFVASDAHDLTNRPPLLGRAFRAIGDRWGEARAVAVLRDNPLAVVENRVLPPRKDL
jgi:protein-tyrosine phosphatase